MLINITISAHASVKDTIIDNNILKTNISNEDNEIALSNSNVMIYW